MTDMRLAVMQDDTVLCADCVHELHGEGLPETPTTIVHAWLADPVGEACWCCGASLGEEG
jgi:hypothetical protein